MNLIGFDTGVFVKIIAGEERALQVFEETINSQSQPLIPVVVLFELDVLAYRGAIKRKVYNHLLTSLEFLARIQDIDRKVCQVAAKLRHTYGLSSMDAIIVACAVESGCNTLYTTDRMTMWKKLKDAGIGMKIKVI